MEYKPKIKRTNADDLDFRFLVTLLDSDLAIRDGSEHAFYGQFNTLNTIKHAVVYYENDIAIGCGAFRKYDDRTAEIKRMFVQPTHRGQGVAGRILQELEVWAAETGFAECILETGKKQPEAIRLYQKAGYTFIPNFGPYATIVNSVSMKKLIG